MLSHFIEFVRVWNYKTNVLPPFLFPNFICLIRGNVTFSIMTLSITTFSKTTPSIKVLFGALFISNTECKWHSALRHSVLIAIMLMLIAAFYVLLCGMSLCWKSLFCLICAVRDTTTPSMTISKCVTHHNDTQYTCWVSIGWMSLGWVTWRPG